jgi:hypothetical protein
MVPPLSTLRTLGTHFVHTCLSMLQVGVVSNAIRFVFVRVQCPSVQTLSVLFLLRRSALTLVYATYRTFKALRKGHFPSRTDEEDGSESTRWLKFWIVISLCQFLATTVW